MCDFNSPLPHKIAVPIISATQMSNNLRALDIAIVEEMTSLPKKAFPEKAFLFIWPVLIIQAIQVANFITQLNQIRMNFEKRAGLVKLL